MIKTLNITPLNTATQVYIDCVNCGTKGILEHNLINTDNNYELEELQKELCPTCTTSLSKSGLPKLEKEEVDSLSKKLFGDRDLNFPLNFYMHLLFDDGSIHSEAIIFSERIESLSQFATKGRDFIDRDRTVVGSIFSGLLKYLKSEGYIDDNTFDQEYEKCTAIWKKYFTEN